MKTKNEFQGNKSIKVLQGKNFKNAIGFKILQHEELMQIKGGDEVGGTVKPHDFD
ncbi:MAG: bacteriocin [Bacteroidales bacterium]|nr:bacteriocin [Bacteroidales bacterium]